MAKIDEQISVLQDRLTRLKLQQQRADARRRAVEQQRRRKTETRRSLLVGALVLAKVRAGTLDEATLRGWLDSSLVNTADRALFDLPPREALP